jgi:hypothetical protein
MLTVVDGYWWLLKKRRKQLAVVDGHRRHLTVDVGQAAYATKMCGHKLRKAWLSKIHFIFRRRLSRKILKSQGGKKKKPPSYIRLFYI